MMAAIHKNLWWNWCICDIYVQSEKHKPGTKVWYKKEVLLMTKKLKDFHSRNYDTCEPLFQTKLGGLGIAMSFTCHHRWQHEYF